MKYLGQTSDQSDIIRSEDAEILSRAIGIMDAKITSTEEVMASVLTDMAAVGQRVGQLETDVASKLPQSGGTVTGSIIPGATDTYDLGSSGKYFRSVLGKTIYTEVISFDNSCAITQLGDGLSIGLGDELYINDNVQMDEYDLYCSTVHQSSDERRKTIIEDCLLTLEQMNSLRSVRFRFNGREDVRAGTIAQDVLKVLPEVVAENRDGYYSLDYSTLATTLALSLARIVKAQQEEINNLKSSI